MSNQDEIEVVDVIVERQDQDIDFDASIEDDADYEWREETLLEHVARSARENPASAALIGAGFLWMALGGSRNIVRGANAAAPVASDAARVASSVASQTAEAVGDAVATTVESAQEAAARASKTVARTARAGAGVAERTTAEAADVAGRRVSHAEDYVERAAHRAASAVTQVKEEISDELRDAVVAVKRGRERARHAASNLARNQPFVLSALCLAGGAALAALLPRTRTENELLGEYKEEVVQTASRRAADFATSSVRAARARTSEAVHGAAHKAADEAAEQVLRQAGGIGEAVIDTFDKVIRDGGAEKDRGRDKGAKPKQDENKR